MKLGFCFYSFLIIYTVGRTPLAGDQAVATPLPTLENTNTEYTETNIHALDRVAIVIGG
jgi:hypothetical protein